MEFAGSMALDGHQMGQLQAVGALPGAKNVSSVPTLDFGRWLRQTVQSHDYVAVKMDIEGAEFRGGGEDLQVSRFQAFPLDAR